MVLVHQTALPGVLTRCTSSDCQVFQCMDSLRGHVVRSTQGAGEPNMRVLISGAGIAGPALAYWLHRHGFDADRRGARARLRAPAGRRSTSAASPARRRADGADAGRSGRVRRRARLRLRSTGAAGGSSEMPADLFGGEGFVAEIEIMRGDLTAILYDATRDDVDYRFGDRITGLRQGRGRRRGRLRRRPHGTLRPRRRRGRRALRGPRARVRAGAASSCVTSAATPPTSRCPTRATWTTGS